MTNPDKFFYLMHWKRILTMQLSRLLFGLVVFFLTTASFAQNNVSEEWTPGQNLLPLVQSDPHDQVKKLLRQEKYARAEVLVDKFMAVNPRDPQMRFWKAWITDRTGDKQVALDMYLSLTQDYPEISEPFNNLAVLYAAKGQFSVAKEALEAALRANPNYADAHENMGDVLIQLANYSFKRSLQINPAQRGVSRKINLLKPSLEINQVKP
jgi:tetratricopeptide (TPR) repeat protein